MGLILTLALLLSCAAPRPGSSSVQLDDLFVRLHSTGSPDEARTIELAILQYWSTSGRPDVDAMMVSGIEMAYSGDMDGALAAFDRVISLSPRFAEAYNQRALVRVMREEYGPAVVDLKQTLAIEPRHFGAWAGLGRIMMMFGRDHEALRCFDAALEINPDLDVIRDEADHLREKLAGIPI